MNKRKTIVVCVGNMLMLDEGFGPYMASVLTDAQRAAEFFDDAHVAELMATFYAHDTIDPDERVPVLDAGTMGMSLIPFLRDYEHLIIVDVIDCGAQSGVEPGSVFVLTPEDMADNTVLHTLHDLKVIDVINNARLAGYDAQVDCVCVQIADMFPDDLTIDLTPKVKAAVPQAVGALMELLAKE